MIFNYINYTNDSTPKTPKELFEKIYNDFVGKPCNDTLFKQLESYITYIMNHWLSCGYINNVPNIIIDYVFEYRHINIFLDGKSLEEWFVENYKNEDYDSSILDELINFNLCY